MKPLYLISIVIFFFSCDRNLHLADEELSWINVYKETDLLIFKSSENHLDSIRVNGTKIWTENRDSFSSSYNPECSEVLTDSTYLLRVCKMYPNKTTYFLNFKNELFVFEPKALSKKSIDYKNSKIDCYEFKYQNSNGILKTLYWNKVLGIVQYIDQTGTGWNLIKK